MRERETRNTKHLTTGNEKMKTARITSGAYKFRSILKSKGWTWNPDEKAWEKQAEWTDEKDVLSTLKSYAGIRNRGNFTVELSEG